jgi:hypothetical protein
MPVFIIMALLGAESATAVPPAPSVISHYNGGRDVITSSASVTCPKQGRYSMTLPQKTGSEIVNDEIVSDDRRLPRSEIQPIQDFLRGAVLEFARAGCVSWTQGAVDIAVNRREGGRVRSVYVPIFLQHRKAELYPDNVRDREP